MGSLYTHVLLAEDAADVGRQVFMRTFTSLSKYTKTSRPDSAGRDGGPTRPVRAGVRPLVQLRIFRAHSASAEPV